MYLPCFYSYQFRAKFFLRSALSGYAGVGAREYRDLGTHLCSVTKIEQSAGDGGDIDEGQPGGTRCPAEEFVPLHVHVWMLLALIQLFIVDSSISWCPPATPSHILARNSRVFAEGSRTGISDERRVHVHACDLVSSALPPIRLPAHSHSQRHTVGVRHP